MTIMDEYTKILLPLKDKLFRFALSVVSNRAVAEDVVQDAYLKLWSKREQLDEIRNIEAWSMRMVKNLCLDYFKSSHTKTTRSEINEETSLGFISSPQHQTEISDTVEQVHGIIDSLPLQQKQIIQLRDVEGYSYKDIADILEIDMNTVKVYLHRARKSIRQQLEKKENYGL